MSKTKFEVTKDTKYLRDQGEYNVVARTPDGKREFVGRKLSYTQANRLREELAKKEGR